MTPVEKKIAVMHRLLEEMTYLGHRLDDMQNRTLENGQVLAMLKAENRTYRNLFEMSPQRLYLKDERLCYVICSKGFASDFNKSVDEVIGRYEEQLVPVEVARIRTQQEKKILEYRQIDESIEIFNVYGQERAFMTSREPVMDNGGVLGVFGVSLDISVYWRRVAELENVSRQQEELLRGQSHQITQLQNNLEYVITEKRQQEERFRDFTNHIEKQLSYRDQELEQLRNALERQPNDDNEEVRIFQRTFAQLKTAVDDARKHIDLLGNLPD
jgi:transcriptional regulator with PAS, ATPase and Fis domain